MTKRLDYLKWTTFIRPFFGRSTAIGKIGSLLDGGNEKKKKKTKTLLVT